jgi:hypothetical protein
LGSYLLTLIVTGVTGYTRFFIVYLVPHHINIITHGPG